MSSGHPRVNCCVEGCRRGTSTLPALEDGFYDLETGSARREFLCETHWRRVPRVLKRRRRLLFRQWGRMRQRLGVESFYQLRPGSAERVRLVRVEHLIRATWKRCRRIAEGSEEPAGGEELPAGLREELRRLAL